MDQMLFANTFQHFDDTSERPRVHRPSAALLSPDWKKLLKRESPSYYNSSEKRTTNKNKYIAKQRLGKKGKFQKPFYKIRP